MEPAVLSAKEKKFFILDDRITRFTHGQRATVTLTNQVGQEIFKQLFDNKVEYQAFVKPFQTYYNVGGEALEHPLHNLFKETQDIDLVIDLEMINLDYDMSNEEWVPFEADIKIFKILQKLSFEDKSCTKKLIEVRIQDLSYKGLRQKSGKSLINDAGTSKSKSSIDTLGFYSGFEITNNEWVDAKTKKLFVGNH